MLEPGVLLSAFRSQVLGSGQPAVAVDCSGEVSGRFGRLGVLQLATEEAGQWFLLLWLSFGFPSVSFGLPWFCYYYYY